MSSAARRLPPVCGARAYLPTALVPAGLAFETEPGRVDEGDVERDLRCTLEKHSDGDHHGLVLELAGVDTGSVWARWADGEPPHEVVLLPDCPGVGESACSEFEGHRGGHSHEIDDPHDDWATRVAAVADLSD